MGRDAPELTTHPVGLDTLDALEGLEALCVFIAENERPLVGAAGYVDWRMCGRLSRLLQENFFTGVAGDSLLVATGGAIGIPRVFALGMGRTGPLPRERVDGLLASAAEVLRKAGDPRGGPGAPPGRGPGARGPARGAAPRVHPDVRWRAGGPAGARRGSSPLIPSVASGQGQMGRHVLIVEGSSASRELLVAIVEAVAEIRVMQAASGFEALKLLPRHRFDLIITDLDMPDISGLELINFVKKNPRYRDTPLFVVTADGRDRDRERGLALGAAESLLKPVEHAVLAPLLRRYLRLD